MKTYYVYLITNINNSVLYTGVTNDIERRAIEHKLGFGSTFTKKYNVWKLVYFEECHDIKNAIEREKQIKGWTRIKKNKLIESINPDWNDLFHN